MSMRVPPAASFACPIPPPDSCKAGRRSGMRRPHGMTGAAVAQSAANRVPGVPEKLLPFVLFALAGSITPGPNNMISTASGAAFGFARTVPQMLGVSIGYPLMIVAFGFGLGEVLCRAPWLHEALRYAGAAFLLYLAWRIAMAAGPE